MRISLAGPAVKKMVGLAAEEQCIKVQLAGLRGCRSSLQQTGADNKVTFTQAAGPATATERVRDAARGSADEQVAAAKALHEELVQVFRAAEAAENATSGLVTKRDDAALSAPDFAAFNLASGVGAGADEAVRPAFNLSAADNCGALTKRTGMGATTRRAPPSSSVGWTRTASPLCGPSWAPERRPPQ